MNRAVKMLQDELNVEISEFTVGGINYDTLFAHKWFLGTNDKIDPDVARQKIDGYLNTLNDDYRVERLEAIKEVFVEVYPSEVFYHWMEEHGKVGGANKFPRVLKKEKLAEWEEYLKKYNENKST